MENSTPSTTEVLAPETNPAPVPATTTPATTHVPAPAPKAGFNICDIVQVPLKGTEKQIEWAVRIRSQFLGALVRYIDFLNGNTECSFGLTAKEKGIKPVYVYQAIVELCSKEAANWWIQHRFDDVSPRAFVLARAAEIALTSQATTVDEAKAALLIREAEEREQRQLQLEVDAEATLTPEKVISPIVAAIDVKDNSVHVSFAEKNDRLREIVKGIGFKWDWNKYAWIKQDRAPSERAVEVANKLMLRGFRVRIYSEDLRKRALSGEYTEEQTRFVGVVAAKNSEGKDNKYAGWFALSWDRIKDDPFNKASKLRGARWSKPNMIVPPDAYKELLDFAELYDFEILNSAKAVIEQREAFDNASVKVQVQAAIAAKAEKKAELAAQKVEVINDLKD